MASAIIPKRTRSVTDGEERVLLPNISWRTYESILHEAGDHSRIRLTYDRGWLEIMSPSAAHEGFRHHLRRLLDMVTLEMNIPIQGGGQLTFRREDLERGLEPDECYWIANEPAVRGLVDYNPNRDPPPDLALEVEITSSAVDRMAIYAELGVPEVWRFDGHSLRVHVLTKAGKYVIRPRSKAFPFLPLEKLVAFAKRDRRTDETTWIRRFRAWVRKQIRRDWK